MIVQNVCDGVCFFHRSFLLDVSNTWLENDNINPCGSIFMNIVMEILSRYGPGNERLITCDRTLKELSKSKYTLKAVPAVFEFISEKDLRDGEVVSDNDEYSLKVANKTRLAPFQVYFLVSDSEKDKMSKLAKVKNYTITIVSPSDFKAAQKV